MGLRGPKARPVAERFAEKVSPGQNGCIEWRAGTNGVGYGVFHPFTTTTNRKVYAHRWAYEQRFGPIPDGLHLDHLCRNPICVNPDHLEPVTPRENLLRGVGSSAKNARKTECLRGHSLSGDNLIVRASGYRNCRECIRMRDRARTARRSADRRARGILPRGEKTHCLRGHPLSGDNLYVAPNNNRRQCRECRKMHDAKNRKA